uniref:Tail assembly chaperone n=1 Tax=viral metagenome TaxID=1070528 RepID=A0A6H1ZGF9_9ZZZZ
MEIKSIGDITVEVQGMTFTLNPREYSNLMYWRSKIIELEIEDTETQAIGFMFADCLLRIMAWEGPTINDKPAPCTMKNKNLLFSQNPNLLNEIAVKVAEKEGLLEKNSETSQAG